MQSLHARVGVCLQVCTRTIGRANLGGEGQSKLGVQVPDKLLDLTNLTREDVERWVSRPVIDTHLQTHTLTQLCQ